MRSALGLLLGLVVRAWALVIRSRLVCLPDASDPRPWVMCFWHGTQFPMLAVRRRRATITMVSHSSDGAIQAVAMRLQGMKVIRGSSSRGGAAGLRRLVGWMVRSHADAAFAVDGPRGPLGKVKKGAIMAARLAGARLVPVGAAMSRGHVFARAWDRFLLPWPFARVVVVLGKGIDPDGVDVPQRLQEAIDGCNARAARLVCGHDGHGHGRRARLERPRLRA